MEVELTNKATAVNGSVTASDGALLNDYTVVIFSETPEHWRLPMTRWVTGTWLWSVGDGEPGILALFALGLVGLGFTTRRRV